MHFKMRPVYIIVAGILLTLIFILVSWNISFMDSKFYSPPQRYYQRSKDSQLQNKESMHWVDHLFDNLRYEKLLTEHVKSKEHLWRALKIDTSRWDRNPPNVLVYLGWVAYWDMVGFVAEMEIYPTDEYSCRSFLRQWAPRRASLQYLQIWLPVRLSS